VCIVVYFLFFSRRFLFSFLYGWIIFCYSGHIFFFCFFFVCLFFVDDTLEVHGIFVFISCFFFLFFVVVRKNCSGRLNATFDQLSHQFRLVKFVNSVDTKEPIALSHINLAGTEWILSRTCLAGGKDCLWQQLRWYFPSGAMQCEGFFCWNLGSRRKSRLFCVYHQC